MIAALFVATGGPYFGLDDVDPYDVKRDARLYAGPHPVVAHPPCERWGRYWYGGPMMHARGTRKTLGDDGGCFASALASVRKWGGCSNIRKPRTRGERSRSSRRCVAAAGASLTIAAVGRVAWSKAPTVTEHVRRPGSTRSASNCRRCNGPRRARITPCWMPDSTHERIANLSGDRRRT